ncbi:MAG: Ig-like domain-containing protein, partial [Dehalococcoidia bacterium]|nr:Ig-like domain-containing protein [Dehalococcoidia bacterium]
MAGPATLTVQPGVIVRFDQSAGLSVDGKLRAVGTASQPITFTGTTQEPSWWDGISINGPSTGPNNIGSVLSYVTLEYGGGYADLYLEYAAVTVTNSIIRNSSHDGINGWYGGVADISNTAFSGNQGYAVQFTDGSVNPGLGGLTASGNITNAVALGPGTLKGAHTWEYTGIPYILTAEESVEVSSTLTIQPGVEMQFQESSGLTVNGRLNASGTASQPITFTASTRQPGWWDGVNVIGTAEEPTAGVILNYATIEYGGGYANVYVEYGVASISHSIIRNSSTDGVYAWYGGAGSTIEVSQIVNNAGHGVSNVEPTKTLFASNNWRGSNSGPALVGNSACNPSGTGSTVTTGVAFSPFLGSAGADPGPLAAGASAILALAPERWFVPADGVIRAWVDITLRNGSGQPLPGRTVLLNSTRGAVVDGGVTDIQGQTRAYVTSDTPGDAVLTASLDYETACESASSPSARITFTPASDTPDLLPEEAAP